MSYFVSVDHACLFKRAQRSHTQLTSTTPMSDQETPRSTKTGPRSGHCATQPRSTLLASCAALREKKNFHARTPCCLHLLSASSSPHTSTDAYHTEGDQHDLQHHGGVSGTPAPAPALAPALTAPAPAPAEFSGHVFCFRHV